VPHHQKTWDRSRGKVDTPRWCLVAAWRAQQSRMNFSLSHFKSKRNDAVKLPTTASCSIRRTWRDSSSRISSIPQNPNRFPKKAPTPCNPPTRPNSRRSTRCSPPSEKRPLTPCPGRPAPTPRWPIKSLTEAVRETLVQGWYFNIDKNYWLYRDGFGNI